MVGKPSIHGISSVNNRVHLPVTGKRIDQRTRKIHGNEQHRKKNAQETRAQGQGEGEEVAVVHLGGR